MELPNMIMPECTLCPSIGRRSKMKFFAINLEYMILACEDKSCPYPIGYKDIAMIKTSNLVKYRESLKLKDKSVNEVSLVMKPHTNSTQAEEVTDTIDNTKKNAFDKLPLNLHNKYKTVKSESLVLNIKSTVSSIKEMMVAKHENKNINNPKMLHKLQFLHSSKRWRKQPSQNLSPKISSPIEVTNCEAVINLKLQNNLRTNQTGLSVINLSQEADGSFKVNVEINKNDTNLSNKQQSIENPDILDNDSVDKTKSNTTTDANVINEKQFNKNSDADISEKQSNENSVTTATENQSIKPDNIEFISENQTKGINNSEFMTDSLSMLNMNCSDLLKDVDFDENDLSDSFIESLLM